MKKILHLVIALSLLSMSAFAQTKVRPYTKKNGTHVEGHQRTRPNSTEKDNYSSKGNVNPYTGKKGTKTPRK